MDRCIATLRVGKLAESWATVNSPFLENYARRCGANLCIDQTPAHVPEAFPHIKNEFMQLMVYRLDMMRRLLERHRRVLLIDADMLVRPDCPDLFDLVPETHWAGVDEASLSYRNNFEPHVLHAHAHMVEVCQQDGLPIPDSGKRYFNCGLQLASRSHSLLYDPPINPSNDPPNWVEQSRINVRLFLHREIPIYYLPECFNQMMWAKPREWWRNSFVVHYCGLPYEDRLPYMQHDAEIFHREYGPSIARREV
jgi:lipopolysaccharide biosynthesis glycosyltransferase